MFRSFFGTKSDRPTPPKNQIEVVCPACGAAQYEPRLVVSTFCKKCGVHLTIHRKQVTASNVTRSGIGSVESRQPATPATQGAVPPAPPSTPVPASAVPPPPAPVPGVSTPASSSAPLGDLPPELAAPITPEEAAEGGFGVFLKQSIPATSAANPVPASRPRPAATIPTTTAPPTTEKEEEKSAASPATPAKPLSVLKSITSPVSLSRVRVEDAAATAEEESSAPGIESPPADARQSTDPENPPLLSRRPQSNSPAPTQAPAPMSASTLQKMKDQGMYRNQYFKDAECFECQHKFKVSRSSRSTNCPTCGALIAMEDVEVNMPSTHPIKTRGDVLIRKRGIISTDSVRCKDLRCYGTLEANVEATGDAIFRTVGTVVGTVRCKRLVIEKGADVTFINIAYAEEVDIQARVTGNIVSSGLLLIGANGIANGDVTARSVSIEPGGELNGAMNIVRGPAKPKPVEPPTSEEASPEA